MRTSCSHSPQAGALRGSDSTVHPKVVRIVAADTGQAYVTLLTARTAEPTARCVRLLRFEHRVMPCEAGGENARGAHHATI
jgi:hypothetical protein